MASVATKSRRKVTQDVRLALVTLSIVVGHFAELPLERCDLFCSVSNEEVQPLRDFCGEDIRERLNELLLRNRLSDTAGNGNLAGVPRLWIVWIEKIRHSRQCRCASREEWENEPAIFRLKISSFHSAR